MEEIATVYSRSLLEVAKQHDRLDAVKEQLDQFAQAMDENREMAVFFFSPYFSTQEQEEALGRVIEGADEIFINFIKVLIENHRMPAIFRIRTEFEKLWDEEHRLLPVLITSAIELDEDTVRKLSAEIGERTGRTVELTREVRPEVIGGIVLRVGNSILDASIRNRLDQLRKQVAQGPAG